jgi:hypothetical protein
VARYADLVQCDGGLAKPTARAGAFDDGKGGFVRCVPPSACRGNGQLGDAQCAVGYYKDRCASCVNRYYRLGDACKPCPSLAWLYILTFVVVLALLMFAAYWLSKKRINLSALGVGVDFLQVVSMFASFNFAWPVQLRGILNTVSASNLNIQLLAPECSLKFSFTAQWTSVALIPVLVVGSVVAAGGGMILVWKVRCEVERRYRKVPRAPLPRPDTAPLEGLAFTALYFLYLQEVKNSITLFDCTTNDLGQRILDAQADVRCSLEDPVFRTLLPWAVASFVVYGLGIPGLFGLILYKYRVEIRGDQSLRALGLGYAPASNPYFRYRQRFQKLYVDFRVRYTFWRMVLLGRKLLLVFVAIMFNKYAMFQASLSCGVMFLSYVLHAKHHPFLQKAAIPMEYLKLIRVGQRHAVPEHILKAYDENPQCVLLPASACCFLFVQFVCAWGRGPPRERAVRSALAELRLVLVGG